MGFKTIGVVRGEGERKLNPSLQFCQDQGMTLYPISRADYRQKYLPELMTHLNNKFGAFYLLLPEGGTNPLAVKGCKEILTEDDIRL